MAKQLHAKEITQRFLLMRDEVINEGLCKNNAEFAKSIGEYPQNFALMEKGSRSPTLDQIVAACTEFNYSANWLLLNLGTKRIDTKTEVPLEKRVSDLEVQIRRIKNQLSKSGKA